MKNRIRYTVEKVLNNQFYQMPKFLFESDCKNLSNDARVLYSLLRDRHDLSIKNSWHNERGEVYLIMTRENMCELMGLSLKTVIKAINDLKKYNLIDEERRGQGNPNILYLLEIKNFSTSDNFRPVKFTGQEMENSISRHGDFTGLNMEILQPNHTNPKNHTESNETNRINQRRNESIDNTYPTKKEIKDNIQLEHLQSKYPNKQNELQELYEIIAEVLRSRKETLRIGKEELPASDVKVAFSRLNYAHIEYVLDCLNKNTTKVTNTKAYLQTTLYNASKTINNHYSLDAQNFINEKLNL